MVEQIDESTIESDALISDVVEDLEGTENHLIISDKDILKEMVSLKCPGATIRFEGI